jgi:hypothetical protein
LAVNAANDKEIVYHLKLGIIKGGEATINITDTVFEGKKARYYKMVAKTTGLADAVYKVYDIYETIVNPDNLLPYKSIRNVSERNYKSYNEVTFHHNIDSIFSNKSGWKKAPKDLLDILTAFFYFTHKNYIEKIDKGETVTLPTMHDDQINNINIKFSGFEIVDTKLGKLECYVLSPQIKAGKLLKNSNGVKLYITRYSKIPVLLEFEMKVGSIRAILKEYDPKK